MSYQAIVLVSFSALLHALWNMYSSKHQVNISIFIIGGIILSVILLLPILYFYDLVVRISYEIYLILIFSSLFQALYFYTLTLSYKQGDLSIAYPLFRSIPILFILIYTYLSNNIHTISTQAISGGCLIMLASIILPMKHLKDFKLNNYTNKMFTFILLCALGIAGYSLLDSIGMNVFYHSFENNNPSILAFIYIYFQMIFTTIFLAIILIFNQEEKKDFVLAYHNQKSLSFSIFFMMMLSYILILIAMLYTTNVAYIVALRQISIPLAFLLGIFLLKEKAYTIRYFAILILSIGLLLNALY
jgi:drug/metabolite transporter (DMT)-like permease